MDGIITHSLFKIMCIMSLFGYEATRDLKLLCRSIIMQVLFPATFITQQIAPVLVHWFLPRKLCINSSFYHEKVLTFPPPFFSVFCFPSTATTTILYFLFTIAILIFSNARAYFWNVIVLFLLCHFQGPWRGRGQGGFSLPTVLVGFALDHKVHNLLKKHQPNFSFTCWTIWKNSLTFLCSFYFCLFETFKPRTFAPLGFKERLNFNSKTLCSQCLSRNRLFLDDCFPRTIGIVQLCLLSAINTVFCHQYTKRLSTAMITKK